MKFDFCIGNPPFQDITIGYNDTFAPPVYDKFMEAAYLVSDKVELVHPARFLFNAGSTSKAWNQKMLSDEHFKVLQFEQDSSVIFANTDIKGGIAITYHDATKHYKPIGIFTPYKELNSILYRVISDTSFESFSTIMVSSYAYHFTEQMHIENPDYKKRKILVDGKEQPLLSRGHEYDLKSNVLEKLPEIFVEEKPDSDESYIKILGRINNSRAYRYIKESYIEKVVNLYGYKVVMSGATGTGEFGETLSAPVVGEPGLGLTESFLSAGNFSSADEASAAVKYIKCKFTRALFSVLKRTQANTPDKWKYVPLQDFASNSDIDWARSIKEIDQQLYAKYNLTAEEIDFIEINVKEMV